MREHVKSVELWDMENEQGPTFLNTTTIWKEDGRHYQYTHLERVRPDVFDLDSLSLPDPIPMDAFKAPWKPSLTECSPPFPDNSYLKSPPIHLRCSYDAPDVPGGQPRPRTPTKVPGDDILAEAEVYEILKNHPHPNICIYYGCVREGDYLTAICLKKYDRTLKSAVDNGAILDRGAILDGIAAGLRHLHTLGLVHNDINHTNIMLDESSSPIIIDFDSCVPVGERFGSRKRDTYGWEPRPRPDVSSVESDLYALKLMAQYLDGNVVDDVPIHPDASASRTAMVNAALNTRNELRAFSY